MNINKPQLGDDVKFIISGRIVADNRDSWLIQLENLAIGTSASFFQPPQIHVSKDYPIALARMSDIVTTGVEP
jgi:hypothetical protein